MQSILSRGVNRVIPSENIWTNIFLLVLFMIVSSTTTATSVKNGVDDYIKLSKSLQRQGELRKAEQYLDSAYVLAIAENDLKGQAEILSERGIIFQVQGDYDKALDQQFKALRLLESIDSSDQLAMVLNNIGSIHHYQQNFTEAKNYYDRCLRLREELGDKRNLAMSYNNFGALFEDMGDIDAALEKHNNCLQIWKELNDTGWVAISYANIGSVLKSKGQLDSALTLYKRSLELFESRPGSYQYGRMMMKIGDIHLAKGEPDKALDWCSRARRQAILWDAIPLNKESCYCLYRAYEATGNDSKALAMYKRYVAFSDTLYGQQLTKEITKLEMDYKFSKQQLADSLETAEAKMKAEFEYESSINNEKMKRDVFMLMGIGIFLLAGGLWSRLRFMRRSREKIQIERERSEKLLLNILPAPVAKELKLTGKAKAKDYELVTVLFSDFVDFTGLAETMTAHELVEELNICFQTFDRIMEDHGMEKIKTIGDAYMAVGGLYDEKLGSPEQAVLAAFELQEFVEERSIIREAMGLRSYQMRIGIHSGPAVAGVVGQAKFQYDIWGDTVNIAARMEQYGEPGNVNLSKTTYELIKEGEHFNLKSRGVVSVKGKGLMEMYYAVRTGERPYHIEDWDLKDTESLQKELNEIVN